MRIQLLFLLLISAGLSCDSGHVEIKNEESKRTVDTSYPIAITNEGLEAYYDSTKWSLYLFMLTDTPQIFSASIDSTLHVKPFSFFQLEYDTMERKADTIKIFFNFKPLDKLGVVTTVRGGVVVRTKVLTKDPDFEQYEWPHTGELRNISGYRRSDSSKIASWIIKLGRPLTLREQENVRFYLLEYNQLFHLLSPEKIEFLNAHKNEIDPWLLYQAKKRGLIRDN